MKPQLLKILTSQVHSFSARTDVKPNVNNYWHYHPEVELVYFTKGRGTQFVGDNIGLFEQGTLVMVGSNLQHLWQFDKNLDEVDVSVIHFDEEIFGSTFLNLPENRYLKCVLENARRGILIEGTDSQKIGSQMQELIHQEGGRKLLLLQEVLWQVQHCPQQQLLASVGFQTFFSETEKNRLQAIYNFTIDNFKRKITLSEAATVAHMTPHSFCKYFKLRSKKTYQHFVNEIRIGHACRLLMETDLNVKEVCYESGFNNFASFHKFFRQVTGQTPLMYQKSFNNKA